jgi:hypothetical protein
MDAHAKDKKHDKAVDMTFPASDAFRMESPRALSRLVVPPTARRPKSPRTRSNKRSAAKATSRGEADGRNQAG